MYGPYASLVEKGGLPCHGPLIAVSRGPLIPCRGPLIAIGLRYRICVLRPEVMHVSGSPIRGCVTYHTRIAPRITSASVSSLPKFPRPPSPPGPPRVRRFGNRFGADPASSTVSTGPIQPYQGWLDQGWLEFCLYLYFMNV